MVKFSGRKPGSTTIQADKEKSIQLKAERAPIEKRIKAKQRQIKPFEDTIQARQEKRDNKVMATGAFAPIIAGATAGAKMGFAVDAASGGGTMGAGTLIGGATGGFLAMFTAPYTALVAHSATEAIAPVNNKDLDPKLQPLLQDLHLLQQEKEPIDTELQEIEADLDKAEKTTQGLQETEAIAKTAVDEKAFKSQHFHHVQNGRESVYQEVQVEGNRIAKLCSMIPGFRAAFNKITGKTLAPVDMLEENQTVLQHGTDNERAAALRRIYYLDKAKKQPPSISYADYARDPDHFPELALAALQILTQDTQMRDQDSKKFRIAIEHALASQNERVIKAGLDAVLATDFHSGTINYYLNKISRTGSPFSDALQEKAKAAKKLRLSSLQGTYHEFDTDASVDRLMEKLVGNAGIIDALDDAAGKFNREARSFEHQKPALKLYLYGEPGIGKTSLVENIHEEFQNDHGEGLIKIQFGPSSGTGDANSSVDSSEKLVERLRQAGPLQGKTIFFDEFTDLLLLPEEQQRAIGVTLRQLFDTEKIGPGQQHPFKAATGIDPRQVILAIATNTDLDATKTLENGTEEKIFQHLGDAAISRIKLGAADIELNPDLSENISDFVNDWIPSPYFRDNAGINWEGAIKLTSDAKERLIDILTKEAQTHPRKRTGRALTDNAASKINLAISKYYQSLDDSEKAKARLQPILISLDPQKRRLVARVQDGL